MFKRFTFRDLLSLTRKLRRMQASPPGSITTITSAEMNALRAHSMRLAMMFRGPQSTQPQNISSVPHEG